MATNGSAWQRPAQYADSQEGALVEAIGFAMKIGTLSRFSGQLVVDRHIGPEMASQLLLGGKNSKIAMIFVGFMTFLYGGYSNQSSDIFR